jgi:tetratricopeptide (TPR) repeat protein
MTSFPSALNSVLAVMGVLRTLVMPLDDLSPQQTHGWIGEGFAEALEAHLQSAGEEVVGLEELHRVLIAKGFSPGEPVTRATVIVMGRELGAARALVGSYRVGEGRMEVNLKIIDLDRGAIVGVIEDHDDLEALLDLENRLAMNLFRLESDVVPASFEETSVRRRQLTLEAHEKLARARVESNPDRRRQLLEEALETKSDYLEARLLLGRSLLDMGQPIEAIKTLSALPPGGYVYRDAYFLTGLAYLAANQTAAAMEIFSNLLEQEDGAVFRNNLGVAMLRTGRTEDAIREFRRAVDLESEVPIYLFNLGWAYWRAGKGSEALQWFREAVGQDPEDGQAHLLYSAAAAAQTLPEEAEKERELAIALSPELAGIDTSTVEGMERVAERIPRPAGRVSVDSSDLTESDQQRFEEARGLRDSGRLGEAVLELQRLLYVEPHWAEARIELADVYRESGEMEKAVGEYRVVLWDQESATIRAKLAETYLELGNRKEARIHAERALELDPDNAEALRLRERLETPQP